MRFAPAVAQPKFAKISFDFLMEFWQTSHIGKRCTKSLASLLYVVQRGADEQSTAVLITRSARDFAQQRISNIRPAPPPPFGGAGLTSDHPRHVIGNSSFRYSNF